MAIRASLVLAGLLWPALCDVIDVLPQELELGVEVAASRWAASLGAQSDDAAALANITTTAVPVVGCSLIVFGDPSKRMCEPGGSGGLIVPPTLFGLGDTTRAWIYLGLLLWLFVAVQIVSGIFMDAIEKITSKKATYKTADGTNNTAWIWNPTLANLSLMALGSSAPEILLNVIAAFPNFTSSALGPSTIVGSAAFNLLVIIAVCIVSIPRGGLRKIAKLGVHTVQATASILAYVWLLVILMWISPNVVEWWEGGLTFLFFWVLLLLAFIVDIMEGHPMEMTKESEEGEMWEMELEVRKKYGRDKLLSDEEAETLMQYEFRERYSRAVYRSQAISQLTSARQTLSTGSREGKVRAGERLARTLLGEMTPGGLEMGIMGNMISRRSSQGGRVPKVAFRQQVYTVSESIDTFSIVVYVEGSVERAISVHWTTVKDTADDSDFQEGKGVVTFKPGGPREAVIELKVLPSTAHEKTEWFHVQLLDEGLQGAILGRLSKTTVTIVDEGNVLASPEPRRDSFKKHPRSPGVLMFDKEEVSLPSQKEDYLLLVTVCRQEGDYGKISCAYETESDSAVARKDFDPVQGRLEFDHLESERNFTINVKGQVNGEAEERFRVILTNVQGGAIFNESTDGGSEQCILTVVIEGSGTSCLQRMCFINFDQIEIGSTKWRQAIVAAFQMHPAGGDDEEEDPEEIEVPPTKMDYFGHFVSMPFKVLFALIPPVDFFDGWPTFVLALFMIGVVTVFIGDLAELLGCCLTIPDSITAITLVALGTSLPDTFASRAAAVQEPTADNSIGNATGSNSVNVFLGLGLPWGMSAVNWWYRQCTVGDDWSLKYPDEALIYPTGIFVVRTGDLSTSVLVFSIVGVICLITLTIRRTFIGGELGGPSKWAWASSIFFVVLWVVYVSICSWYALRRIAKSPTGVIA